MTPLAVVRVALMGAVVGAMTWLLLLGLERYILKPLFCDVSNSYCTAVPTMALSMALVVGHFIGLYILIRLGVIRPLLVVLAVIASLWGFQSWISGHAWWLATLYAGMLFGLAYVTYAWINRLLSFPLALILTVIAIVVARLLITS